MIWRLRTFTLLEKKIECRYLRTVASLVATCERVVFNKNQKLA